MKMCYDGVHGELHPYCFSTHAQNDVRRQSNRDGTQRTAPFSYSVSSSPNQHSLRLAVSKDMKGHVTLLAEQPGPSTSF